MGISGRVLNRMMVIGCHSLLCFNHPAIDKSAQTAEVDLKHSKPCGSCTGGPLVLCRKLNICVKMVLLLGGGLENAINFDEFRVLNQDGLRYGDEFCEA